MLTHGMFYDYCKDQGNGFQLSDITKHVVDKPDNHVVVDWLSAIANTTIAVGSG
jgi:hypothetical protein